MSLTYAERLQAFLNKVPRDIDKREGSIIYDAGAPCMYFLTEQDFKLKHFPDLIFGDTAVGEYLDRIVGMYGLTRKRATRAVRRIQTNKAVPVGSRWKINDVVYKITEKSSETLYIAICETSGSVGNLYSGHLQTVSQVTGVTAELTDIVSEGTNTETDEALRERFYIRVRTPATSGNAAHYKQWALEVAGVGSAKVLPLRDGPGTVTVLVVNSNMNANEPLAKKAAEYIETVRPIGATVTVRKPDTVEINISAKVTLAAGTNLETVKETFEKSVDAYLKSLIFDIYKVSSAKIGGLLLDTSGVEDYGGLTINGGNGNVSLTELQIPVIGTATLTEGV